MVIKRNDQQLPAMVQKPRFDPNAQEYLEAQYALGRKTLKTMQSDSGHINFWTSVLGDIRLNQISHKLIQNGLIKRKETGVAPRTLNICLTVLRNVLRHKRGMDHRIPSQVHPVAACPKEEPATLQHPTAGQALRECDASLKERSALL